MIEDRDFLNLRAKFIKLFQLREDRLNKIILERLGNSASDKFYLEYCKIKESFLDNLEDKELFHLVIKIKASLEVLKSIPPYNNFFDFSSDLIILVDFDDTLFKHKGDPCKENYSFGSPIPHVVKLINLLYKIGCTIHIYTKRMNSYINNQDKKIKNELEIALKENNINYHKILETIKPTAEVILDDLAINPFF